MARVTNAQIMAKLDSMEKRQTWICEQIEVMNGRQRTDHDEITRLKEQMSTTAKAQAAFTSVAAVVAAWLGLNR